EHRKRSQVNQAGRKAGSQKPNKRPAGRFGAGVGHDKSLLSSRKRGNGSAFSIRGGERVVNPAGAPLQGAAHPFSPISRKMSSRVSSARALMRRMRSAVM